MNEAILKMFTNTERQQPLLGKVWCLGKGEKRMDWKIVGLRQLECLLVHGHAFGGGQKWWCTS